MEFDAIVPLFDVEQSRVSLPLGAYAQGGRADIRLLSERTAARIAAGEVIERPAAVVKELVENALDAGARHIRIDVQGGGLGLIRVSDDGVGIPARELWLACQRHATSKLPSDDLTLVQTLGFRGEALPSIAVVAELTVTSAIDESGVGQRLTLRNGRTVVDEPAPRSRGTTVTVRRLFERLPARLAAAGRAQAEIALIGQMSRRLALAAPSVRLVLYIEDRLALQTSGSGDLATTMVEVYGEAVASSLIALGPVDSAVARLYGVVSGPEVSRPGRGQVNLLVNGRWVQPRGLQSLLEAAYRTVLPRGRHPLATLVVDIAPDRLDINIHPTKLEVRLRDEHVIGSALGEMVRDALGRRPVPLREPLEFGRAMLDPVRSVQEEREGYDEERPIVTAALPPLTLVGQVHGRLLLLEGASGLYLVDQHRAHERIIFERLKASHATGGTEHQALPEPLLIELRPAQAVRFARRMGDLEALGFHCEEFGGRTFLLRATPVLPGVFQSLAGKALGGVDSIGESDQLVSTLLSLVSDDDGDAEGWRERLLIQLSCRTALRRGRLLDRPTMRALVETLGNTESPAVCPHGSPLLMHLSGSLLERQFDWH
jgi:DNA mismatch repair protein MutL